MNKVKQIEFDPPYFDEEEREIMEALKQTLVSSILYRYAKGTLKEVV